MTPFTKARGNNHYANPDDAPRHGPYAHCWWDRETKRWKLQLKPKGKAVVAEYIARYPNPAAILFQMRSPKCAIVLAKRWLLTDEKASEAGSAAMTGVVRAAMKFDPSRGFQFTTLVPYYILSEVQDLDRRLHRSREENMVRPDLSKPGFDGDRWDVLGLEDDAPNAGESLADRDEVRRALTCLDARSRAIVRAIYLDEAKTQTLEAVGRQFGMSKERVRQIKEAAFERMRNQLSQF